MYLEDNKPVVIKEKCVGCGICENVCKAVNQPIAIRVSPVQ
jgi:NAD-dependent dihydropyrimidine dehydrogenase PreA subunit